MSDNKDPDVRAMYVQMNKRRDAYSNEAIRDLALKCAGIGAGAILEQAPDAVMPVEKITMCVDSLLKIRLGIESPS